jgi:hypothetical protein
MNTKDIPSRRQIMRKFGLWLDWMEFAQEVNRGEVDPPDGRDFADMVRTGIDIKERWEDMTTQERLRYTARALRKQRPRAMANGEYVDELLTRSADEIDHLFEMLRAVMITNVDPPPENRVHNAPKA